MKMQGLHPVFQAAMAPFLAPAQAAPAGNVAADRLPAIRDVLADFRAAATDKAARRERDIREAREAVAEAALFNPTPDMVPVAEAVAQCDDTASLIRVAGALLEAVMAKDIKHSTAHMIWADLQDVISNLRGVFDKEADAAAALQRELLEQPE